MIFVLLTHIPVDKDCLLIRARAQPISDNLLDIEFFWQDLRYDIYFFHFVKTENYSFVYYCRTNLVLLTRFYPVNQV